MRGSQDSTVTEPRSVLIEPSAIDKGALTSHAPKTVGSTGRTRRRVRCHGDQVCDESERPACLGDVCAPTARKALFWGAQGLEERSLGHSRVVLTMGLIL